MTSLGRFARLATTKIAPGVHANVIRVRPRHDDPLYGNDTRRTKMIKLTHSQRQFLQLAISEQMMAWSRRSESKLKNPFDRIMFGFTKSYKAEIRVLFDEIGIKCGKTCIYLKR